VTAGTHGPVRPGRLDRLDRLDRIAACAGIVGGSVMAIGSMATAVAYRGADGERFSPTNHFVSELGELAHSELARTFNLSVIAGGLCFAVFMSGLAASRPGWLRVAAGGVGIVAGVAGSFVGVFPMDDIGRHTRAAMTFFNLGWIAVALASLDFVVRPDRRFPRPLAIVGLATVAAFIGFLREVRRMSTTPDAALDGPVIRPEVWALPTLEWLTIIGIVGWVMLVGAAWLRAGGGAGLDVAAARPCSRRSERPGFQMTAGRAANRWNERPAFHGGSRRGG
jgi:hypothetical membrane protein